MDRASKKHTLSPAHTPTRGVMSVHVQRWVTVILDCSEAMTDTNDMLPSRLVRAVRLLQVFVLRFFDKNPLSQVQIILTSDGLAAPLTPLSGSADSHVSALRRLLQGDDLSDTSSQLQPGTEAQDYRKHLLKGRMSLQNSLITALKSLSSDAGLLHQTSVGANSSETTVSKEVFFLLGGLSTQDPSNIFSTVEKSKRRGITIDVVHLAADVYICRYLAERTGGRYVVALNEDHCQKAMKLIADAPPPSVLSARGSRVAIVDGQPAEKPTIPLLLMGFPGPRAPDVTPELGELIRNASEDQVGGLWCPRCYCRVDAIITALHSKFASALDPNDIVLPTNCQACGLLLVKASHLARSYKTMMKPLKMHRVKLSDIRSENPRCTACAFELRLQITQSGSSGQTTTTAATMAASHALKVRRRIIQCGGCACLFCYPCANMLSQSFGYVTL